MRGLSEAELLDVWERGLALSPARRGLDLLGSAWDEEGAHPASLSVGRRDRRLLELRTRIFGRRCTCRFACPQCGEQLEAALDAGELLGAGEGEAGPPFELELDEYHLLVRLPDSRDLIAVERCADITAGTRALLERCVLSARRDGIDQAVSELPAEVVGAVEDRMAECDPWAERRLALSCPTCGHAWEAAFDALAYLWAEIDAGARRTLREIHLLASRYGWSEAEVLSVSPTRRWLYLEAAGS